METENDVGISKMPNKNSKGCGWVCTLHNLEKTDNEYLEDFKKIDGVKFFKGQREIGEKTGKEHLQFFIDFENAVYFSTVQKLLPLTTHIEQRKAKKKIDAVNYCCKEKTRIGEVLEFGKFTDDRQNTNTEKFFERLYGGANNMELQKEFPTLYAQYGVDKLEKFRQDYLKAKYGDKMRDIKITYIYGSTRLGKTSYIYDKYKPSEICRVTNYKVGTFENYKSQKVLVLDEFTGLLDITFVNNLLDRLPLDLPARYGNRTACFTEVYIISNLAVTELYKEQQNTMPEVYRAFTERIHEIIKFTAFGKSHYEKRKSGEPKQIEMTPVNDNDMPF